MNKPDRVSLKASTEAMGGFVGACCLAASETTLAKLPAEKVGEMLFSIVTKSLGPDKRNAPQEMTWEDFRRMMREACVQCIAVIDAKGN